MVLFSLQLVLIGLFADGGNIIRLIAGLAFGVVGVTAAALS